MAYRLSPTPRRWAPRLSRWEDILCRPAGSQPSRSQVLWRRDCKARTVISGCSRRTKWYVPVAATRQRIATGRTHDVPRTRGAECRGPGRVHLQVQFGMRLSPGRSACRVWRPGKCRATLSNRGYSCRVYRDVPFHPDEVLLVTDAAAGRQATRTLPFVVGVRLDVVQTRGRSIRTRRVCGRGHDATRARSSAQLVWRHLERDERGLDSCGSRTDVPDNAPEVSGGSRCRAEHYKSITLGSLPSIHDLRPVTLGVQKHEYLGAVKTGMAMKRKNAMARGRGRERAGG